MKARVTLNRQLSGEIAIENGVNQGDITAPILFTIFPAVPLTHALKDCDHCIPLRFRTSDKVFNLRRFNTKSEI